MSLRRAIKAEGLGNVLKLGYAIATSQKVVPAPKPHNETLRAARVNDSGLIGRDVSRQFEIFAEICLYMFPQFGHFTELKWNFKECDGNAANSSN